MKKLNQLGFLFVLLLVACGEKTNQGGTDSASVSTGQFSYIFRQTLNGEPCSTGRKTAQNHEEFCALLANDSENRDAKTGEVCARSLRAARLKSVCPEVAMLPSEDASSK